MASTSNQSETIVYSAESDIRSPFQLAGEIVRSLSDGREIAWRLFLRNLRGMYRQTFLGLFWAFLPPIAFTAMWIFLQSQGAFELGETGVAGTLYILTGMILWQGFIDAFQMPMNAIKANKNMVSKLRFPREALLLAGLGEVLFNLAIRLLLLVPAFIYYQAAIHPTLLLAPFAILAMIALAVGMGLLIMPIGSLYQDMGRFITMVMPLWMIVTPIIYVPKIIAADGSNTAASLLNWVNPAAPLLILSRDLLLMGSSAHWQAGIAFGIASIIVLTLGLVVFRISLPVLIERMMA